MLRPRPLLALKASGVNGGAPRRGSPPGHVWRDSRFRRWMRRLNDRARGVLVVDLFANPPNLDALTADVPPLRWEDDFQHPRPHYEEWGPFVDALKQ